MISVTNLTKYYGDVHALKSISFEIKESEIVGILGPNGAGKSTTLRILTSFLTKTSGKAVIDGKDIDDGDIEIKEIIGYLPESAPIYNDMIVYDYLLYMASIQNVAKEKLDERMHFVVDACNLKNVIDKPVSTLSKGYKQRVGIAGAIIHDPKILILDEPTNGLDPNQIIEIRDLIKKLGEKKTVLISTHILSEVEATCSRVIIINDGLIIKDSATDALIRNKNNTTSIKLSIKTTDNDDDISKNLKKIDIIKDVRIEPSETSNVKNITIIPNEVKDKDPRDDIYNFIKTTNWVIYEMSKEKEDLEAIFQALTKGEK